jgi:hypothetical protein
MVKAVQQAYGDVQRSWSGTTQALKGAAYFWLVAGEFDKNVQLDVRLLLQDAAAMQASSSSSRGVAAGPVVTVAALLQFVSSRTWHESNPQLNVARRALAERLVQRANAGLGAKQPARTDAAAYTLSGTSAGNREGSQP